MRTEKDVRIGIIKSIISTPHKNITPLVPIHTQAEKGDPLFYAKMAVWYDKNGTVRDHKKLFASKTITSDWTEFRDLGQHLLHKMPLREAAFTVDIARDHFKGYSGGKARRIRSTIESVLRTMEKNTTRDNGVNFLRNAKVARNLYRQLHIAPGSNKIAASLKFKAHGNTKVLPAFNALRSIGHNDISEEQICELIVNYKLPPMHVLGTIKELTPAIAAALLESMSVPETVNYMSMFERKGLLDVPEFKKAIQQKLNKRKKSKSVSMRTKKASKVMKTHSDVMDTATDSFVDSLAPIKKKVVLAIDKSWSMSTAIELGKEVATILAAKVVDPAENLMVVVFDSSVKELNVGASLKYTDFESQFRFIAANGTTSLGAIIDYVDNKRFDPDVITFITDAEETMTPMLDNSLAKAEGLVGVRLINCKVGKKTFDLNVTAKTIQDKALEIENIDYDGDYYSLPNLVKLISSGGIRGLIAEIDAIDISKYIGV